MKVKTVIALLIMLYQVPFSSAQFLKPGISFHTADYNFGTIKEADGPVFYEFEYTNTGRVPLILNDVKATCGCTTPEWTKEPVVPGRQGSIKVKFDPKNRPGPFSKSITVICNADPPRHILTIKGTVIPAEKSKLVSALGYRYAIGDLMLQTVHASFGDVFMGSTDTASINMVNSSSEKSVRPGFLKIPDHISVRFEPEVIPPGEMGRIVFIFSSAKRNDWDFIIDRLLLTVNGELMPRNTISLTANVKEDFSAMTAEQFSRSPVAIFDTNTHDFGSVPVNTRVEHGFLLTNKGRSDLYVRKVNASCGCTAVQPSKTVITPGESTVIKVQYDTRGRGGADKKAVTVITNDPRRPKTILWIKAFVESPSSQIP
ncbi:MAG: DUF1573 domain-containing protein [Bacteroidales bacterium]|nr:DUF1573 domain-containing protein [Bacteroidales bacterium]MBN2762274.1 DUF1573 domain-containing protein [Bacteroidales bacterium]